MKRNNPIRNIILAGALAGSGMTMACATSGPQSREVDRDANRINEVKYGSIIDVESVELDNPEGYEGALVGATLGGLAGVAIGDNTKGRIVAGTVGAVLGGVAGNKIQEELKDDGYEYTVRLDSGRTVSIVEVDETPLRRGERVKLIENGKTVRVMPAA